MDSQGWKDENMINVFSTFHPLKKNQKQPERLLEWCFEYLVPQARIELTT